MICVSVQSYHVVGDQNIIRLALREFDESLETFIGNRNMTNVVMRYKGIYDINVVICTCRHKCGDICVINALVKCIIICVFRTSNISGSRRTTGTTLPLPRRVIRKNQCDCILYIIKCKLMCPMKIHIFPPSNQIRSRQKYKKVQTKLSNVFFMKVIF